MEEKDRFQDDEIDLFEIAGILWRRKAIIIAVTLIGMITAVLVAFLQKPVYRAKARIVPIAGETRLPFGATELLNLIGISGIQQTTNRSIIKAVLESRELAKRVILSLNLKDYLLRDIKEPEKISLDALAESFKKNFVRISEDRRTGAIDIIVDFPEHSTLPALIANEYVRQLSAILSQKAYTIAKRKRIFIENQLKIVKRKLEEAERKLNEFQKKYGVFSVDKQTEESIKLYAQLVAELTEKEVQYDVLRKLMSPQNPKVIALKLEIDEIKQRMRELEKGDRREIPKGYVVDTDKKIIIPLEKVPDIALEFIRIRREVEIQTQIYKVLLSAWEQAKIEEAKEEIAFQVIDTAYEPQYPVKPKKKLIVAVGTVSAGMLGIFLALLAEAVSRRKSG